MRPGYYGKLPIRGDFLSNGLSSDFVGYWDSRLQRAIHAGQVTYGARWEDIYFESPVWRFFLIRPGGLQGLWAGLLLPSIDSVSRHFPLTVAWELPDCSAPYAALAKLEPSLEELESRLVTLLLSDGYDHSQFLDVLDLDVDAAGREAGSSDLGELTLLGTSRLDSLWCDPMLLEGVSTVGDVWWTRGSDRVAPKILLRPDFDYTELFTTLIEDVGIESMGRQSDIESSPGSLFSSSAFSVLGRRSENQDRYLQDSENGYWAVIDGMGGHRDGALAADTLLFHLDSQPMAGDLEERMAQVQNALQRAHREIASHGASIEDVSGAAVVVLLVDPSRLAAIWCGDARLYAVQNGSLDLLTSDHANAAEGQNVLTRAIGFGEEAEFETCTLSASDIESLLLCSDGLYRTVDLDNATYLSEQDTAAVARRLLEEVDGNSSDNATAVVVKIRR